MPNTPPPLYTPFYVQKIFTALITFWLLQINDTKNTNHVLTQRLRS